MSPLVFLVGVLDLWMLNLYGCSVQVNPYRHGSLERQEVLIVDCQTTGATPKQGHLLELGWARIEAANIIEPDRATSRLIALPDGAEISRQVSRITGIQASHLKGASDPETAWAELSRAAGALRARDSERGALTIIHYAQFEERFLRSLQETYTPSDEFPLDIVCTHQIARKLLPDLPRRGLRALAGYFGASPTNLRRSAAHVAATSVVWRHLLQLLCDQGVTTVGELRVFLQQKTKVRKRGHKYPMDRRKRLSVPDKPGVYHMLRQNGDLLYVGKATSLFRRVNSYFQKQSRIPDRTLEMLTQARDLRVHETESALEAALLENDHIKELAPPYNVALQADERRLLYTSAEFDEVAAQPSRKHRIGPFASAHAVLAGCAVRRLLSMEEQGGNITSVDMELLFRDPEDAPAMDILRDGVALFRADYLLGASGPRLASKLMALGGDMWREQMIAAALEAAALETAALEAAALQASGNQPDSDADDSATNTELDADEEDGGSDGSDVDDEDSGEEEAIPWTAERVTYLLARVTRRAAYAVRRGYWLCRLSEASIAWQVPGSKRKHRRLLMLERGAIVEARDIASNLALPTPRYTRRSVRARHTHFDVRTFDRLRILTTELRRLVADSASVQVRFGPRTILERDALERTLAWV